MNNWELTINYINNLKDGEDFTPSCIANKIYPYAVPVSNYVNYLRKAMFIERVSRGRYISIREIPTDLTLTKIKKFIYPIGANYEQGKVMVERYWKLKDLKEQLK